MSEPNTLTAYHRLRTWIVEGQLRPGERIVETRVADVLALSRTPVREALRMLQSEGLVRVQPHRGATVRSLSTGDIADLYELRARLESMAAEFAAQRRSPEESSRLAAACDAFADAAGRAEAGDLTTIRDVSHCNDVFHLTLLEAAHHERLTQTLVRTVDHTLVFQAFRHYRGVDLVRSALFHELIATAIAVGVGDRAGRLIHEHVMQGRDELLDIVGDGGSVDALYDTPRDTEVEALLG